MQLVYVGAHSAVEVPVHGLYAERNAPVEVPDPVALSLLEQPENWAKAPSADAQSAPAVTDGGNA